MKEVNIFGNSQREQWHSVVNLLRQLGGSLDRKGRSDICDELDRYIDFCEDHFAELKEDTGDFHSITFSTDDYDEVSRELTDYEEGTATAEDLYLLLTEIHGAMARAIN